MFLKRLSSYIQESLTIDKSSVWIAQAEGRAKNGKDLTDTALLKMLSLAKAKGEQFSEFIQKLNVIPVAISYEYDPCIRQKVAEIHAKRIGLNYKKSKFEVMHSIRDVLDDIPAVLIDQELSRKFRNGLSFEYFNKKSENDYLLIETNRKFVGIGKAIEGKIKPVRVFNL